MNRESGQWLVVCGGRATLCGRGPNGVEPVESAPSVPSVTSTEWLYVRGRCNGFDFVTGISGFVIRKESFIIFNAYKTLLDDPSQRLIERYADLGPIRE